MSPTVALLCLVAILGCTGCLGLECPNVTGVPQVPLPHLDAKKFHYNIEISINDLNKTLDALEFFDAENNLTFLYLDQASSRVKMSFDFNNNQTFIVDELNETCTVMNLTQAQGTISLIGVNVEKGPLSVKNAFVWNAGYNATDLGIKVVDGIQTNHYQTCLSFEGGNLTYLVDVFFSRKDWSMPAGQNAPVMLQLNATTETDTDIASQIYTYKFYDYHDSTSKDLWSPMLPGGMICDGRKDTIPNPFRPISTLTFSLGMEMIFDSKLTFMNQYVDMENMMVRLDVDGNPRTTIIHDFQEGLQFTINRDSGKCETNPIPLNSTLTDVVVVNNSLVKMVAPGSFMHLQNARYGGITDFAGFKAHAWISDIIPLGKDDYFNGSAAWVNVTAYMSVEDFNQNSQILGMSQTSTSLQQNGTVNVTYNMQFYYYNFRLGIDEPDTFQATPCFNSSQQEEILLKFESPLIDVIKKTPAAVTSAVVSAVADAANVSKTRVVPSIAYNTVVEMDQTSKKNKTYVYLGVPVLGVPDVKGDSVEMVNQICLATAVQNVKTKVGAGEFILKVPNNMEISAVPNYFNTQHELLSGQAPPPPPQPTPGPGSNTGLSAGVVAGVSVAMLIVGIMIGCFVMICRNRRGGNQYAYTMHED